MRLDWKLDWKALAKRAKLPALGVAVLALIGGAYWLGGLPPAESAAATSVAVQDEPRDRKTGDEDSKPAPVSVPRSAAGARSSGAGGQTWATGDTGRLGAEFRRSVTSQFGEGTIGQAHKGMAGLGFSCSFGSGGAMNCSKSLKADNCTLTWSVRLQSDGGDVGSAGGEGFSRNCD